MSIRLQVYIIFRKALSIIDIRVMVAIEAVSIVACEVAKCSWYYREMVSQINVITQIGEYF